MNVERVNGVDAQFETMEGIFFNLAGGGGEDGHIDVLEFGNVVYNRIAFQFGRAVFCTLATDYAAAFHVGCGFNGFKRITADVAVANDGSADFLFHVCKSFVSFLGVCWFFLMSL